MPWALTEGNAVLTFFPASTSFLVVSGTFALLVHRIMEGSESSGGEPWGGDSLSFLEPLGRITLTVYVLHFAVLGVVAYAMQGEPRLEQFLLSQLLLDTHWFGFLGESTARVHS